MVKPSGGLKKPWRKKRLYERGSPPTMTKLGPDRKVRVDRVRAGELKQRLIRAATANVFNPETKTYSVAKIKTVKDNPANRHFTRANILTRGAIIETEIGKARVTNRPGQEGAINAVLIEKKA